tara:strand:- start:26 stop:634 length:609 start_codon:yes stop_codon:yes gene_type:complete
MTKIIIHRVNTLNFLKRIPHKYGVEIDIRTYNKQLVLTHDNFKKGISLEKYLDNYNHSLLVANIKEAGIEDLVINEIKKRKIKNFFLLDVEFPYIYRATRKNQKNIAIRYSEEESIETVKKYKNKLNYVWIDTFTKLPINKNNVKILNSFHKCLVSPDRWNRPYDILKYIKILSKNKIIIDSVMTEFKYRDKWEQLNKIYNL